MLTTAAKRVAGRALRGEARAISVRPPSRAALIAARSPRTHRRAQSTRPGKNTRFP